MRQTVEGVSGRTGSVSPDTNNERSFNSALLCSPTSTATPSPSLSLSPRANTRRRATLVTHPPTPLPAAPSPQRHVVGQVPAPRTFPSAVIPHHRPRNFGRLRTPAQLFWVPIDPLGATGAVASGTCSNGGRSLSLLERGFVGSCRHASGEDFPGVTEFAWSTHCCCWSRTSWTPGRPTDSVTLHIFFMALCICHRHGTVTIGDQCACDITISITFIEGQSGVGSLREIHTHRHTL